MALLKVEHSAHVTPRETHHGGEQVDGGSTRANAPEYQTGKVERFLVESLTLSYSFGVNTDRIAVRTHLQLHWLWNTLKMSVTMKHTCRARLRIQYTGTSETDT